MMAERRDGVFRIRCAVGKRGWADGGVAYRSSVEAEQSACSQREIVERGQFHEEIVGVLAVDNGQAVGRFALLEEQGIAFAGDGRRLEAEHAAQGELADAEF